MAKYEDGEYIDLYYDDRPDHEPVKGWFDVDHCQKEIDKYHGENEFKVIRVEHKYAFWGCGHNYEGERSQMFYERDEPGRGRFKVTLAFLERV